MTAKPRWYSESPGALSQQKWPTSALTFEGFREGDRLKLYIHDLATSFRMELEGNLSGKGVLELEQSWRTACSVIGNRPLVIVVGNVGTVDPAGKELLDRLHQAGAQFVAKSASAEALVTAITGQQIMSIRSSEKHRRDPRFRAFAFLVILLVTLPFPATAIAGPATINRHF